MLGQSLGRSRPAPRDIHDGDFLDVLLAGRRLAWPAQHRREVRDAWSAMRYCIDMLRARPDLRARFPAALSEGAEGRFARWLAAPDSSADTGTIAPHLIAPHLIAPHLTAAFARPSAARVENVWLSRPDVRAAFPLGLTRVGRADLLRWFIKFGCREEHLRREEVWWFFLLRAEDPANGIPETYLFTPEWQRLFPDGLTVFGAEQLAAWLAHAHPRPAGWSSPARWAERMPAAEQIRLGYQAHPAWREAHPAAFASEAAAAALLAWLRTPPAGLGPLAGAWCTRLPAATARELAAPGVNILGHFCYPSGLQISAKAIAGSLRRAGVKVRTRDVAVGAGAEPTRGDFAGLEIHDVSILHVQPEPLFDSLFARAALHPRPQLPYRIGYWYWELNKIPERWRDQAADCDEIWAASSFVADALRATLPQPVFTMFPGLEIAPFTPRSLGHFGLEETGDYTFLFVFNMLSVMERKNPLGLAAAFRAAFAPGEKVRLVIKTSFGDRHPEQLAALRAATQDCRIVLIDSVMESGDVTALMQACDAYVSLHRSEGLGLTMAEAMLLGKPVIATGYSGNTDFMDQDNSLLVEYRLVPLEQALPPYEAGLHWAEPSVEHAAQLMRRVYDHREWAAALGAHAARDAGARMSVAAAGRRMRDRLQQIAATVRGPS